MYIHISPHDGVPIYLQIVNQVKYHIASGQLEAGAELPAIRVLAVSLLINPNTVARAYRDLATAGLVRKKKGAGTFVSDKGSPLAFEERDRIIDERIDALLAEARQMNITIDALVDQIKSRHAAMKKTP